MNKNIIVVFNDNEYFIEIENECTYEDFQILVYSVTEVEPTLQRFYFLGKSIKIPSPFEKINVLNNQKILLFNSKNNLIICNNNFQTVGGLIDNSIKGRIEGMYRGMYNYKSDRLKEKALNQVPIIIRQENDQEKKMKMLLDWFKNEHFCWVNSPDCSILTCGTPSTKLIGHDDRPTQEEQLHQASRIEVYKCDSGHITRFPRYNSVEKLLETKSGRCGEWANAFTLFCIALGFKTRYIYDVTDHVWNEVYINNRWIHVDSCEATYDSPLQYEGGWGKQLSYIFAFELDGVYDVTPRYTIKPISQLKRHSANENDLLLYLDSLNHRIRLSLPFNSLSQILTREHLESLEFQTFSTRKYTSDLTGRVSGSTEWKNVRGESGGGTGIGSDITTTTKQETTPIPKINNFIFQILSISKAKETLELVGDCDITRNGICLTPDDTGKCGGFWIKEKVDIVSNGGFICKIKFLIKTSGADGMAFVIQNESIKSLGIGGCGLGYQGISNSIAIEFDTYETKDHCKDPNGNHISINTRGLESNSAHHRFSLGYGIPFQNKPMNDGLEHECYIAYNNTNHTINLWLDNHQIIHNLSLNIPQLLKLDQNKFSYIGMTASTGGLKQTHIISSFSIGN